MPPPSIDWCEKRTSPADRSGNQRTPATSLRREPSSLGPDLLCPDSDFVALASDKLATDRRSYGRRACRARDVSLPHRPGLAPTAGGAARVANRSTEQDRGRCALTDRATLAASWNGDQDVCVQEFCAGRAGQRGRALLAD